MTDKTHIVELSEYVADLSPTALKEVAPPPIARRVEDMLDVLHARARRLKDVAAAELVCALIHTTDKDDVDALARRVETYREAQVWQTLGTKAKRGEHTFLLPGPGRRKRAV